VLIADKPRGPTSHDVVARVRRLLGMREVGHAGTLDPMATGVLVLALGEATKLVPYLTNAAKEYEARVVLGRETDTLDALGTVTTEARPDRALLDALAAGHEALGPFVLEAIAAELTRTSQEPPAYSAIQTGGERAYAKARRGEAFVLEAREVRVRSLLITRTAAVPEPFLDLRVRADKGYYVRSLARDLARRLGTVGHLASLRRTDSGGFRVEEAVSLTATRDEMMARVIPLDDAARRALPALILSPEGARDARLGRRVRREDLDGEVARGEPSAWFGRDGGGLVAVGLLADDVGRVLRGFGRAAGEFPSPPRSE